MIDGFIVYNNNGLVNSGATTGRPSTPWRPALGAWACEAGVDVSRSVSEEPEYLEPAGVDAWGGCSCCLCCCWARRGWVLERLISTLWDLLFGPGIITRRYPASFGLWHYRQEEWYAQLLWPIFKSRKAGSELARGGPMVGTRPIYN
ncbi:MAG TPA: hypothetical protein VGS79_19640 [Puia sp.]|nr:hypothetical protein [Puia sp.]